jgi:hypothetical protein
MKTSLLLSRVVTRRGGIGLHPFERHFADGSSDPGSHAAFLRRVLNPSHSVCPVLSNLAVSSVNHELSSPLLSDTFLCSVDSFLLSRKGFARLAHLLYRPSSVGTIYMNRFHRHILIVRVYRATRLPARPYATSVVAGPEGAEKLGNCPKRWRRLGRDLRRCLGITCPGDLGEGHVAGFWSNGDLRRGDQADHCPEPGFRDAKRVSRS